MPDEAQEKSQAFWSDRMAEEEPLRETRFPLVAVQTELTWRVLAPYLTPKKTGTPWLKVLDAGAGTGRYSLPIAEMGHQVTHLDVSGPMLERAQKAAALKGLAAVRFQQGSVLNLEGMADRAFDLVLCMDSPIAFCYPRHEEALREVCRVTGEVLALMVPSRLGSLPFLLNLDISGELAPPGYQHPGTPFPLTTQVYAEGAENPDETLRAWQEAQGKWVPPDYAFRPEELVTLLEREGFAIEALYGPAALARCIREETLRAILDDPRRKEAFLTLSLRFDQEPSVLGMGGVNLLAVARRK
ncbi:MAG: class I SAM-dependent methyltransferase [Deltaproteobacteria bacterium]|nr:class I SAM-dependent methyltransferase [Deltaproteobacteria bacterium]